MNLENTYGIITACCIYAIMNLGNPYSINKARAKMRAFRACCIYAMMNLYTILYTNLYTLK